MISCVHVALAERINLPALLNSKELVCADCDCHGPNLWICLYKNCLRIGCAEKSNDHSTLHNATSPTHCVHMNLSTKRIWCYECKREVFMSQDDSDGTAAASGRAIDSGRGSYATLRTATPDADRRGSAGDASDSSDADADAEYRPYAADRPRGLVGLQNIGNTCYMNAALQALSNTEPLTKFFLDCSYVVHLLSDGKKPGLSRTYQALMRDVWIKRINQGYVTPSGILYGIRSVHTMFRGYQQHDTQEFLRNFMDQLHEELKQPSPPDLQSNLHHHHHNHYHHHRRQHQAPSASNSSGSASSACDADTFSLAMEEPCAAHAPLMPVNSSGYDSSEAEYETCDSGVSERSSLSDDNDRPPSNAKRRLSRCSSPNRRQKQRVVIDSQPTTSNTSSSDQPTNKKQQPKYRSIISDIFDGKLLSSVQCLTCDRVSSKIETFQDLSLPIPSRDHLQVLHGRSQPPAAGTCSEALMPIEDGWVSWLLTWLRSWFYGPTVTLHDCLAAFFSTDELKGDNMYSCEKCNKLRNGVKFSKVLQLPEVLCVHLKRFRHELMFSSKISSTVSFPLRGLDMRPYLHVDCASKVSSYELFSVICHHGTAGGGHYTCFAANSGQWYEFDDQYVTKVSADKVRDCEAYVLFYRKGGQASEAARRKAEEMLERCAGEGLEEPIKRAYISRQWINRFYYCSEPGPIDNSDFLCQHGAVSPDRDVDIDKIATAVPLELYQYLHGKFGGCAPFVDCAVCPACAALQGRLLHEMETFLRASRDAQARDAPHTHYLSSSWYTQWHNFVQKRNHEPPGPIDNTKIDPDRLDAKEAADVPEAVWTFFHDIYGGGPEIRIRRPDSPEEAPARFCEKVESEESDAAEEKRRSGLAQGEPMETSEGVATENGEPENGYDVEDGRNSSIDAMLPNNKVDNNAESAGEEAEKEAEKESKEYRSHRRYRRRRKN
ncbi:unnamed protein product [Phyllotreta striolata]|uniref:Ubiquitin carboxyl-terminal hydrolase n=1 Tax=Phyllotreta striolata TaxID=444603 RepID=A0A9N9XMU0_PHYSR|nr:unnamed protein product [Phyllotreta striolata]